jgi:hypothetical protein
MIIATQLRLRIGSFDYETTPLTLGIKDEAYVRRRLEMYDPSTIYRPDGSTFKAVIFSAGSFRRQSKTVDPVNGVEHYHGVESTAGWYVIDPDQAQPSRPPAATARAMDDKRGLFVPVRSMVADSWRRLFG